MEIAGLSVALVTLPVSVIQSIKQIREGIERFRKSSEETTAIAERPDTLLNCASRLQVIATGIDNWHGLVNADKQIWNNAAEMLIATVGKLETDVRGVANRKLQARLVYALGMDKIKNHQQDLSRAIEAVHLAIGVFTACQQLQVRKDLAVIRSSVDALPIRLLPLAEGGKAEQDFNLGFSLEHVHTIPHFVPRPEYMTALDGALLPDVDPGRKVYVLHGLGGIGKTQLAVKFARDHQRDFSASFFLDASSQDALLKGFVLMYRRITEQGAKKSRLPDSRAAEAELKVDYMVSEVKLWLSLEGNSRCQDSNKGSIRTTWTVPLHILRDNAAKSDSYFAAYHLLQLFSYFHPCNLEYKILRRGLIGHNTPAWFKTTFGTRLKFFAVIKILLDLSLVDHVSEGVYSMHRVVHDWLCTYVCPNTDIELIRLAAAAVSFSGPIVKNSALVDDRLLRQQLAIHASIILPRLRGCDPSDLLVRYNLMSDAELEVVASLRGSPARCWSLLQFESPLGGVIYTLSIQQRRDVAPAIEELLSRCPRHLDGDDTGALNPAYVLLTYDQCTSGTYASQWNRLRRISDDFLALGSRLWAACALNSLALRTTDHPEAIQLWESALVMSRSVTGTLFLHPTHMIFSNLYTRLRRGGQKRELLELYESDLIDGREKHVSAAKTMLAELSLLRKATAPDSPIDAES